MKLGNVKSGTWRGRTVERNKHNVESQICAITEAESTDADAIKSAHWVGTGNGFSREDGRWTAHR